MVDVKNGCRQAIATKYLAPTNTRGGRVKASCSAGSVTVAWDHALDVEANHDAAAKACAEKFGWDGKWIGGGTEVGFVYVQVQS